MFHCKFCRFRTLRFKLHMEHRVFHSNITNKYWCGLNGCQKSFRQEISLRSHVRRIHNFQNTRAVQQSVPRNFLRREQNARFVCSVELCKEVCDNRYNLIKHLKRHIEHHVTIECPFHGCDKKYNILNSFTSHITKKHNASANVCDDRVRREIEEEVETVNEQDTDDRNDVPIRENYHLDDNEDIDDNVQLNVGDICAIECRDPIQADADNEAFQVKLAQMYLKLESQLLIPSSSIQYIASEMLNTNILSRTVTENKLKSCLLNEGMTPDRVTAVMESVFERDSLLTNMNSLRTTYRRRKFFKEKFAYVEPIEVVIAENGKKKTWFHYVPIIQTLKELFSDKSLANELNSVVDYTDPHVLSDFTDGSVFQRSTFFKQNPDGLKLILYQDGFEVVNPIGSAIQKFKMVAIYMSIGDLNNHTRSHVNSIKLIALCKEKEFDHEKVYGRIVSDLKVIEKTGIELPSGRIVKGAVVFITGDNLGSHQLGGFLSNFSVSTYFCRYCLITRDDLQREEKLTTVFEPRTINNYNEALHKIGNLESFQGIKFDSVFNRLENFHVCMPGLPPCIGHDLLEGVVAYDMKLYIDLLQEQGWFSYATLNDRISSFPYSRTDLRDKPCYVSKKKKRIVGGAWQILIFLKLFPLLIEQEIKDASSEVWKSILLLTEIAEIICAPAIHRGYLPYLSTIILEYLALRMKLHVNIRPKHHYLTHYPEFIQQFGPLMNVWTMRFESKHAYFKRALRFSRNYINVTKSMSEKHELLQSFLRAGADARSHVEMKGNTAFDIRNYNEAIQAAVKKTQECDLQQCEEVVMKGTVYKTGDALFIHKKGYTYGSVVGKIILLLCAAEEIVYAVCEVLETIFRPHLRAYELGACLRYECVSLDDSLPSREALHIYKGGNVLFVKPIFAPVRYYL